jgi:hypothetical protein
MVMKKLVNQLKEQAAEAAAKRGHKLVRWNITVPLDHHLQPLVPVEPEACEEEAMQKLDELAEAFKEDFPCDDLSPEELDRLYAQSVRDGLFSEDEYQAGFEKALSRSVAIQAGPQRVLSAYPSTAPTLGECIGAYLERRKLNPEEAARRFGIPAAAVETIALSRDPYLGTPNDFDELVRRYALTLHLQSPGPLRALLQEMKVILGLASTSGASLAAARRSSRRR